MTSYRSDEAIDWFGFSRLWSRTLGYVVTTSRIDSLNRRKTLNESRLLKIYVFEYTEIIAILQNTASNPIHQSVKYCVRNLCRASARLQISSLSFAPC